MSMYVCMYSFVKNTVLAKVMFFQKVFWCLKVRILWQETTGFYTVRGSTRPRLVLIYSLIWLSSSLDIIMIHRSFKHILLYVTLLKFISLDNTYKFLVNILVVHKKLGHSAAGFWCKYYSKLPIQELTWHWSTDRFSSSSTRLLSVYILLVHLFVHTYKTNIYM